MRGGLSGSAARTTRLAAHERAGTSKGGAAVVNTAVLVERASQALAERVNRRSFIRKGADTVFGVGIIVGGAGGSKKHKRRPGRRYTSDCDGAGPGCPYGCGPSQRSEEHTSELQSLRHL